MMKYRLFIALTVVLMVILTWGCSGDSDDNPTDSTTGSGSSSDTIAPRLLVMQPVNGSSGVPINITIAAQFSEEMDSTSFNDSTFYLSDGIGAEITYVDKWARLRPYQNLQNSHSYTVTLSPLIEDTACNALAGQYLWSFTTIASDIIPPEVITTTPVNGATEVALNTNIIVEFSEPMDTTAINENSFFVSGGVTGHISYHVNSATFNPSEDLVRGNTYVVILSTQIEDQAGNSLMSNYHWSFSTIIGDTITPQITGYEPEDGAINIPSDAVITVNFSEEMDPSTISSATFYLDGGVTGNISYDNLTATLIPDNPLDSNQTYTATVTTGITDTAGNHLPSEYSWSFTTWPGGVIMPLAIGNLWEYHVWKSDTIHTVADYYDTMLIVDDTLINSELWFKDQMGKLYINRPDGLWLMGRDSEYLSIKYPCSVGESYMSYIPVFWVERTVTLLSTTHYITTEQGSYVTHKYVQDAYEWPSKHYYKYAPGVGLISYQYDPVTAIYLGELRVLKALSKVELQ